MTTVSPPAYPSSRILAGWWRQLSSWQPQAVWVGHLLLHQVEAQVRLTRPCYPDPSDLLLLQALTVTPEANLAALDQRLGLGRQMLMRWLRRLQTEELAARADGDCWVPTQLGRQALEHGAYPQAVRERRFFHFVEGESPGQPPRFLNLMGEGCVPWSAPEGWQFDGALLQACITQSPEWKRRHGFPLDVEAIGCAGSWQQVMLDLPQRLTALMIQPKDPEGKRPLLGFAVRTENWELLASKPILALPEDGPDSASSIVPEASPEEWRQAWTAWCQPRALASAETEACPLEKVGPQLRIAVPARVLDRLRATRSDALKGEAWLLAGTGRVRSAALLQLVEASLPEHPAERG